jgi:hypothetical protein
MRALSMHKNTASLLSVWLAVAGIANGAGSL